MIRAALFLWLLPRNCFIVVLLGYRRFVSPLYGDVCRYYPSCSRYALDALQDKGVIRAVALGVWRILRCNPWSAGGIDDVTRTLSSLFLVSPAGLVVESRGNPAADTVGSRSEPTSHPVMAHSHRKG